MFAPGKLLPLARRLLAQPTVKRSALALAFAFLAAPLAAQSWSAGVATGPFIFGDFMTRESRVLTPNRTVGLAETIESTLSADVRAGALVYVERHFSEQLSVQLEATFTRAPLSIENADDEEGVDLDVGDMDASSFALPLVWRFNRGGRFRPFIGLGPAYVLYNVEHNVASGRVPIYEGTRGEWGGTG